ncbi:MAG TPA: extracellular solute-binding protein [Roseiflexaceae bacterium]
MGQEKRSNQPPNAVPEGRMTRRAFLKSAVAAGLGMPAISALLAACGGGAPQAPSGASSTAPAAGGAAAGGGKPASLNMLYATVEADVDAIKLVLPDFKAATGIDIKLDSMPYDALQQKAFAELAASSSYYDVMICDTPWTPALTQKLEPLSGYITNAQLNDIAKVDINDFIPKVFFDTAVYHPTESHRQFPSPDKIDIDAIKSQGFDVFGLPLQANVLTMSYRKDLFDDAKEQADFQQKNGKPLKIPETWDDFVTVAQFFTRPDQRLYGTTVMAGNGDWATDDFKTLLASWGGDGHLVTDKFELAFNSQQGVDALSFYADLINKYKVTPPGATSFSWDTAASTFASGLTALSMNYHTVSLNPDIKGQVAYAQVPKKSAYGPHFGTWMLSVNKFSQNKEWAYRAITWFTSADAQAKMLQTQLHPSRISVYEKAKTEPSLKDSANFYDILGKSLAVGVGRPRLTNYGAVDKEIWVAVNQAASGSMAPKDALSGAAAKVTSLLKEAGYPVG